MSMTWTCFCRARVPLHVEYCASCGELKEEVDKVNETKQAAIQKSKTTQRIKDDPSTKTPDSYPDYSY
jgi:hypothetical protein